MDSLSPEQVQQFKDAFSLFDKDGSGTICIHELDSVMKSIGQNPSQGELQKMIKNLDGNENETIDVNEFIKMMALKQKNDGSEAEMRAAFKMFDKDGNGQISTSELKEVMTSLGEELTEEDYQQITKDYDHDGSGHINYEEFIKMMSST